MKLKSSINIGKTVVAGLTAGFASQMVMAPLFLNPVTQGILYNPQLQSRIFLEITPLRNIVPSVIGLMLWGIVPAFLYQRLDIRSDKKTVRGVYLALWIWLLYWLPQEWFIYVTLLGEPLHLAAFELLLTAIGTIVQGLILVWMLPNSDQ